MYMYRRATDSGLIISWRPTLLGLAQLIPLPLIVSVPSQSLYQRLSPPDFCDTTFQREILQASLRTKFWLRLATFDFAGSMLETTD
mmetsp:Transcript_31646/g.92784  ORF Transcript_31646/g.92784 Transcript_31646/m.92784 type:complete len:86 (-) Transcript_31646:60-317(-)